MIVKETLYALDDVTLIPEPSSKVRHRAECNIFRDGNLPIFVAPMDSVVNIKNFNIYKDNNLIPILPRTETLKDRWDYAMANNWAAFSLEEFDKYFAKELVGCKKGANIKVLIDIANGHIEALQDSIKKAKESAKEKEYTIEIMAGNVANPYTYVALAKAGADYVRISVGSGQCCITSSNTSVHYPMASLIDTCAGLKKSYDLNTKIIADGGISSYSRAIKALALGADYVMIGTTLAKCYESASPFINVKTEKQDIIDGFNISVLNDAIWNPALTEEQKKEIIRKYRPTKLVYGMSTKRAQRKIALAQGIGTPKLKTSEGIEREIPVEYTLHQWVENFSDYLRSAMSYCNKTEIEDFISNSTLMLLSESAKNSINK